MEWKNRRRISPRFYSSLIQKLGTRAFNAGFLGLSPAPFYSLAQWFHLGLFSISLLRNGRRRTTEKPLLQRAFLLAKNRKKGFRKLGHHKVIVGRGEYDIHIFENIEIFYNFLEVAWFFFSLYLIRRCLPVFFFWVSLLLFIPNDIVSVTDFQCRTNLQRWANIEQIVV